MRARLVLGLSLLCASFLGGCGASSEAGSGPTLVVGGSDTMRFAPDTLQVKPGQEVTIIFQNKGMLAHDLAVIGADKNPQLVNVGPGKQQSAVFLANNPGTYQFVCNQPAHKESGMVGKIVVG